MRALSDGERAILAQDGPEDEADDFTVLSYRAVRSARKAHHCDGCSDGPGIAPGDPYNQWVALDGEGRFGISRFCRGICRQGRTVALAAGLLAAVLAQRAQAESHPPPPPPRPAIWTLPVFIQALPPDPSRALCERLERRVLRRLTGPAAQRRMRVLLNGGRTRP